MSADAAVLKSCMLSTVVGVQLDILQEVGKQSTLSLLGHILPVISLYPTPSKNIAFPPSPSKYLPPPLLYLPWCTVTDSGLTTSPYTWARVIVLMLHQVQQDPGIFASTSGPCIPYQFILLGTS